MKMTKQLSYVAAILAISIPSCWCEDALGRVEGKVVGINGKGIQGASVYAMPLSGPRPGRPYVVQSDQGGQFLLDKVPPGRITIRAYKESEYYSDSFFAFYMPSVVSMPELNISAGETINNIVVKLDRQSGLLRIKVLDAKTGNIIDAIHYELCRKDHSNDTGYCLTGSRSLKSMGDGDFEQLVPPDPITISISADGYKKWRYRAQEAESDFLTLEPRESKTLTVFLQRED